jgi:HdeA/HdeB family
MAKQVFAASHNDALDRGCHAAYQGGASMIRAAMEVGGMGRTGAGAAALIAALLGGPAAQAQTADLARATCAQLTELPRNDRGQLIVWLHGYYAGAAQRAVLDRTKLEDALAAVQQQCERNPAMPLIGSEARSLFLGDTPPPPVQPPVPAPSRADPAARPRPTGTGR